MMTLVLAALLSQSGDKRSIDVEAAVRLAIEKSPMLAAVHSKAEAVADQSRSVRGRMLPGIYLSEEHQRYSEPFKIEFNLGIPGAPAPSLVGRELNTNTFVASAQQPVLGLVHLAFDKAGLDAAAEAARVGELTTREAITESIETAYLRYFEAVAAEEVARSSVAQLEEQHQVTLARVNAGAATNADLLRVDVATANARQQLISARAQQRVISSSLLLALGFSADDTDVELVRPTALENAEPLKLSASEAQRLAASARSEVERARLEHRAAEHQATAKLWALLPEANLEAAYVHLTGQAFAPVESMYVGIKATWPVWEWGASWYQRQAATHTAEAAASLLDDQRRQVKADASNRVEALESSRAAVEVAQTAIASAEEAWRVTQALLKAGTATTTDLLDAQSALTQARLNLVRARYQQAVATVALKRAVGQSVPRE